MWSGWWALPGPSAFVDELVNALRTGQNLIIALPEHAPPELGEAVARRVDSDPIWRWRRLALDQARIPPGGPAALLFDRMLSQSPSSSGTSVESLATTSEMRDRVLWIEGISADDWDDWQDFVVDYARTCRTLPQLGRGLLCCVASAVARESLPKPDAALSVLAWAGRLDELDIQIWIAQLLRGFELTALERRARRVLAAGLAGFDPVLAQRLAGLDLELLVNPLHILRELASERGWSQSDIRSPTWHAGMLDMIVGERQTHLALQILASQDAQRHIDARLWQAQVSVLFPLIEQKRKQILSAFRGSLYVPFDKGDGSFVKDIEDLEVSHLYYQLRNHRDPRIEPLLRRLRDARNALAHLDVLNGHELVALLRILAF